MFSKNFPSFRRWLAGGCVYVLMASSGWAKPNVVIFFADDHGQFDSIPYGSPDAKTPNLVKLADEGMLFDRAFVASPSCAPSRAAMLTGLMPARNGAEANHTFKKGTIDSLPDAIRKLGYQTACFGKVAHGKNDAERHGFDHIDLRHDADVVEAFLKSRDSNRPLCLMVGTHAPHVPWPENKQFDPKSLTLPPKFVDTPETREQFAKYLSGVSQADADLGAIRELTKQYLTPENTLFIYTSDHGGQWPFGKWNLYDTGIRVPLIAVLPDVIPPKSRTAAMVQWIDILPTVIDVIGGSTANDIDGRSFAGVLRGERQTHRDEVFTTHSGDRDKNVYPIRSLRTERYKYILNLLPDKVHTTHIDRGGGSGDGWRYFDDWVRKATTDSFAKRQVAAYHRRPAEELYDLESDPHELNNLANEASQQKVLVAMRERLSQWMTEQNDSRKPFDTPKDSELPYPTREP